ncbi:MAG: ribonuclease HI family protein [Patescibacteria group bacterium]
MSHKKLITYTDGGARGNPGPSALGVVIKDETGTIEAYGHYLGKQTNNIAEYSAVLSALERCKHLGAEEVEMRMDSELIVKQMTGVYRVKNPGLAQIYLKIHNVMTGFKKVTFHHVRREKNTEADEQVNKAIDAHFKR